MVLDAHVSVNSGLRLIPSLASIVNMFIMYLAFIFPRETPRQLPTTSAPSAVYGKLEIIPSLK